MKKKPAIPAIPAGVPAYSVLEALKENVEVITGTRNSRVGLLTSSASGADIINKVNLLIATLQNVDAPTVYTSASNLVAGGAGGAYHIDGGHPDSVYTADQIIDGGGV